MCVTGMDVSVCRHIANMSREVVVLLQQRYPGVFVSEHVVCPECMGAGLCSVELDATSDPPLLPFSSFVSTPTHAASSFVKCGNLECRAHHINLSVRCFHLL